MALDSRDKRASAIGVGSPVPRLLPNPAGTIVSAARRFLTYLYGGISPRMMMGRRVGFISWCDPAQSVTSYPDASTLRSWSESTVSFTSEQN